MKRGAILYDFLFCQGGAERVTLELVHGLRGADLCVDFFNREAFQNDTLQGVHCIELGGSEGFHIPGWRTLKGLYNFRCKTGFLDDYDWVIYSGSNAPIAVMNHAEGRNIFYCHTIPRFVYDLKEYYLGSVPFWQRLLLKGLIPYVQRRFEAAMARMDVIIANSENVRGRIRQYLGYDAQVVYPPCDVESYKWREQGDYYLSTARLEPYKRIDLIVKAFKELPDKRLVVSSGGSDLNRLRKLAGDVDNISFVGWQDDQQLKDLVGRAIATVYVPRDEDFGMSPVESMAAGKPVIGIAEGGLLETVVDGETGLLLSPEPTPDKIVEAVRALTPELALGMRQSCEQRATLFSRERFLRDMQAVIDNKPS